MRSSTVIIVGGASVIIQDSEVIEDKSSFTSISPIFCDVKVLSTHGSAIDRFSTSPVGHHPMTLIRGSEDPCPPAQLVHNLSTFLVISKC